MTDYDEDDDSCHSFRKPYERTCFDGDADGDDDDEDDDDDGRRAMIDDDGDDAD